MLHMWETVEMQAALRGASTPRGLNRLHDLLQQYFLQVRTPCCCRWCSCCYCPAQRQEGMAHLRQRGLQRPRCAACFGAHRRVLRAGAGRKRVHSAGQAHIATGRMLTTHRCSKP